jgi:hypothetical protein
LWVWKWCLDASTAVTVEPAFFILRAPIPFIGTIEINIQQKIALVKNWCGCSMMFGPKHLTWKNKILYFQGHQFNCQLSPVN